MPFPKVNPKQSFPALEEEVLKFWKENDTFQKSIDNRPADNPYRFYDGPPFITGTPHYGSLLSSIIKDIIPRYQTMQGKRVERKWGWDCHGLPIEEKVQKKLGLESNKEIEEKVGIEKFIEECYSYTKETSAEWQWYIDHIGRWVDTDNAYKTMDQDYMESVMWVFKGLWEKGMIYKGRRVSLYSWKLSTPISNFEVAMDDSYEEVSDPAITVMFPLTQSHLHVEKGDYLLAWTTTPWTIPAHMAIAVNPELAYSRVLSEGSYYILATARVETVFKGKEYEMVESFLGTDLIGLSYDAPFKYYQGRVDAQKNHRVLEADFVTDTDGTGVAHEAPEFGDVDFQLAQEKGVHISNALDDAGKYTQEISDYEGMHYAQANDIITEKLKELGRLFKKESINHRVAMCPRSGTPLIYKAQDSWFINIQDLKEKLIRENEGINWQPNHLKHGQFLKSVESAPDWCISRTRYWGTPMPIWVGHDSEGKEQDLKVFGSKEEIFQASKESGLMNKFLFIRHRQAQKNVLGIHECSNVPELNKLSPLGEEQAGRLTESLKNEKIDIIISSPLGRCLETIEGTVKHHGVEVVIDKRLWETDAGEADGQLIERRDYAWDESEGKGGESLAMIYERVKIFIEDINQKYSGKTIAIVSHGHPLWMMKKVIKDFDYNNKKEAEKVYPKHEGFSTHYVLKNNNTELDLHRPYIDDVTWEENGLTYTRLPEVLDVWMDSGSMPYAQMHYPFENSAEMEASYPADFIVEYIGQVRAWFYVMHVVGVALFDKRSFTNVITTGIVNGSDGRKMSKSYGNYPDPKGTIQSYGADAIRFYMANSPLLTGGNMDFKEEGILEVVKKVILPLWNTYSFFTTYANIDGFSPRPVGEGSGVRANPLDTWITSETHTLVDQVIKAMETYEITEATRPIVRFMDNLTNWYIRRSRKRFWKSENDNDKLEAYETLYEVLVTLCQVMAPFTPFVTEHIYKNLTDQESLHLTDFPTADSSLIDAQLNTDMDLCQKIINLGLSLRTRQKIRVRQPLSSLSIGETLSDYYKDIIKEELNIKEVLQVDSSSIAQKICKPNGRLIGPKFGKNVKDIISQAKAGNFEEIDENTIIVLPLNEGEMPEGQRGWKLNGDEFEIAFVTQGESENIESGFGMVIAMDLHITPELELEGYARDIVRHIQEARKEAGYEVDDRISINIICSDLESILASYDITGETLSELDSTMVTGDLEKNIELGEGSAKIILKK